ncbi:MAG: DoxX family protein [Pseudomonadales bacterium]|jgi:putative oxidoreductase|nr:DoxX family protein [Pseudomonadales bacterium]
MNYLQRLLALPAWLGARIPESTVLLVARLAIASVFWRSVQTKITGWQLFGQSFQFFHLSGSTFMLFQYEYHLPLLSPTVAAYAGTFAEFFFSLMLAFGLFTRFAALGLIGVTAVIEFVYPDAWPTHILWFALLLLLLRQGAGSFSLDRILGWAR